MSRSYGPPATFMNRAASATDRASGPKCEMLSNTVGRMSIGIRPRLGFKPTRPQKEAGMRTEPPMSVPSARGTQPEATAAPEPPDDPPGVRSVFHGFLVTPHSGLSVKLSYANSGVVVLPTMIAPARARRRTMSASSPGTQCSYIFEPRVVVLPAVGVTSLIATGSPCMGPSAAPDAAASSASRARARASSANTKQKQLSLGFSSSMRARQFSISSTGDRDLSRISRTSSTAGV